MADKGAWILSMADKGAWILSMADKGAWILSMADKGAWILSMADKGAWILSMADKGAWILSMADKGAWILSMADKGAYFTYNPTYTSLFVIILYWMGYLLCVMYVEVLLLVKWPWLRHTGHYLLLYCTAPGYERWTLQTRRGHSQNEGSTPRWQARSSSLQDKDHTSPSIGRRLVHLPYVWLCSCSLRLHRKHYTFLLLQGVHDQVNIYIYIFMYICTVYTHRA